MRSLAAAASLAASLLAAGCFGHCGFMPDGAEWTDPSLWAAMQAHEAVTREGPDEGLPFNLSADGGWGPHTLVSVERSSEEPSGRWTGDRARVVLEPQWVTASWTNQTSPSRLAALLHGFLANITASGEDIDLLVTGLLDAAQAGEPYGVGDEHGLRSFTPYTSAIAAPGLDLEGLWARQQQSGSLTIGDPAVYRPGPATVGAWAPDWVWTFSVGALRLQADGGTLVVAPGGKALFGGLELGDVDGAGPKYEANLREWLRAQGLPEPEQVNVNGSIC